MGAFTDENGVVDDSFLVYISNQKTMSIETKAKIEQIKKLAKDNYPDIPTFEKMMPYLFLMGYGACVWDNKIGLDDNNEQDEAVKEIEEMFEKAGCERVKIVDNVAKKEG